MAWLLRTIHALVSRNFRMWEACKRLPQSQRLLIYRLDVAATRFRNSLDHTTELLSDSGAHWEMTMRAATAREERNALVKQCESADVPQELIDYFGDLSR